MIPISLRNLVILALIQIGTVVGCVLAAGVSVKWHTHFVLPLPVSNCLEWFSEFGLFLLMFPIIWIARAAWIHRNTEQDDVRRTRIALIGLFIVSMILFTAYLCEAFSFFQIMVSGDTF